MSQCKTIAICNQKGGVGKTTTAVNLGAGLARKGKRVLLVDTDAQANLTMSLGYQMPDELQFSIATIMNRVLEDRPVSTQDAILENNEGFDLIPSNIQLSGMETALVNAMSRENILKSVLEPVKQNYDYILIDCQPSLGLLTINALAAADTVIIPVQAHFLSVKGLEMLTKTITKVKKQINPRLMIDGILVTMLDKRSNFSKDVVDLIREQWGQTFNVFKSEIPASVRAVETSAEGQSIFVFDKSGKVAAAYEGLTKEVLSRGERQRVKNQDR